MQKPAKGVAVATLTHGDVLRIALPITLSNATVPLIGLVDTAVVGQLGRPDLMGAVAVGGIIFSIIYWIFGFLRMGTTGLTAQALGAGDKREIAGHLLRALLVAIVGGVALVALQRPVRWAALYLTGGSPSVAALAGVYYDIRVWAIPAGFVNFAVLGWLIGLGRSSVSFVLQLILNLTNMALAMLFVLGFGAEVAGVAWAALIAEYAAAVIGIAVILGVIRKLDARAPLGDALDWPKLERSLLINSDIALRSLGAFTVVTFFTAKGAAAGDVTLAANALLTSIKNVIIYLLDGFAFAVEALVGRAIGAKDRLFFWRSIELTTVWAAGLALLLGIFIYLAGPPLIVLTARSVEVQAAAQAFLIWAAVAPIVGVWCFQLDGIFIGATRSRDMRNMMAISLAIFFAAYAVLGPSLGNHGLWASVMVFYVARAATLYMRLGDLDRSVFK